MLCEGEKMSMTASNNGWPQMIAERPLVPTHHTSSSNRGSTNNSSITAAGARVMDSTPHDNQQRQQQPPLRCPRCDSTNTKFCYYNNYSLSQPRHFCKACKRYWTRGGTLRNVPVGGGCRKNKRVKKPSSSSAGATPTDPSPPLSAPTPILLSNPTHLSIPGRTFDLNPLLYGLTAASPDVGLIFPTFSQRMELPPSCAIRSSIPIPTTAYDLQPQLNALGLGFPSNQHDNADYTSRIGSQIAQLQQPASVSSPASLLHDYSLVGSSLSTAPAASLLVSSLKQPKEVDNYQALLPYADHLQAFDDGNLGRLKDVKIEHEPSVMSNEIDWQLPCENPYETMSTTATAVPSDSSSSFYWNAAMGAWPDAANCGPSLAPLI